MNLFIPLAMVKLYHYCSSTMMALGLNNHEGRYAIKQRNQIIPKLQVHGNALLIEQY